MRVAAAGCRSLSVGFAPNGRQHPKPIAHRGRLPLERFCSASPDRVTRRRRRLGLEYILDPATPLARIGGGSLFPGEPGKTLSQKVAVITRLQNDFLFVANLTCARRYALPSTGPICVADGLAYRSAEKHIGRQSCRQRSLRGVGTCALQCPVSPRAPERIHRRC